MKQLKHHEQKLLKKANFFNWKKLDHPFELKTLKRYQINDRDDFKQYIRIVGKILSVVSNLGHLPSEDPERLKMTNMLLQKLYDMGVIHQKKGLWQLESISVDHFARRRLSSVICRLKFAQHMEQAVDRVQHGHVRIGPEIVSDPATHVTREMEDHIHWAEGSTIKRHVKTFNNEVDDYQLLGN